MQIVLRKTPPKTEITDNKVRQIIMVIKSTAVGVLAFVVSGLLTILVLSVVYRKSGTHGAIGLHFITWSPSTLGMIMVLACIAAFLEYRHLSH